MTMRDTERFKDKIEVSLDGRQIFFLFFGGAVVACLVFVLGVMVGRRLEGRERVAARAQTSAAMDPLAALDELGADEDHEDLTFPSALTGDPAAKKKTAPEESLPAADPAKLPPPVVAAKPAMPAAVGVAEVAPEKPVAVPVTKPALATPMATPAAAKAPLATTVPPPLVAPPTAPLKKKTARFTLQLSSFQDRSEANSFIAKLVASGYKPYVVASEVEGRGVFFRVRIGEYEAHADALAAKTDFERRQHIIAYVTRL